MRQLVTICDFCKNRYVLNDGKESDRKTVTIDDHEYDICIECYCKLMRFIHSNFPKNELTKDKCGTLNDFVQDP